MSTAKPPKPTQLGQIMPPTPPEDPQDHHNAGAMADMEDTSDFSYGVSHTQSWTWSSPRATQEDLYAAAKACVGREFRCFPGDMLDALKSLDKWCEHAADMKMVQINLERRRIAEKELQQRIRAENKTIPIFKALDGMKTSVGQGAVLCFHTLWCPDYKTEWRRLASWPTIAELKWEGEDRARTKVGRYFPLPRESSNAVPWNYCQLISASPFDEIWKVPTEEDILYPMYQISEEIEIEKHRLLNQDILDAIDPGPYDVWAKDDLPKPSSAMESPTANATGLGKGATMQKFSD